MTRAEKRAAIIASLPPESAYTPEQLIVRRMYIAGYTLQTIADELSITKSMARRHLNPVCERAYNTAYRDANREKRREWDRAGSRRNRKTCCSCDGEMGIGTKHDGTCRTCFDAAATARKNLIVELYNDGASLKEIAARLGTTVGSIGVDTMRLRKAGLIGVRPGYESRSKYGAAA